ncbi:helix-turn-helix domain-containing protein, partial [Staphylococcus warneri]
MYYKIIRRGVIMKNQFRVILAERKLKISDVYSATGIAKTTLYGLY